MSGKSRCKRGSLKRTKDTQLETGKCVAHGADSELFCMSCRQAVCMHCMHSRAHITHSILAINNAQHQLDLQADSIDDRLAHVQSALSLQQKALLAARCVHETKLVEFAALVVQLRNELHQRVDEFSTALLAGSIRLPSVTERRVENSLLVNAERTHECLSAQRALAHVDKARVTCRAKVMKQFNGMFDESSMQSHLCPAKLPNWDSLMIRGSWGRMRRIAAMAGHFPHLRI